MSSFIKRHIPEEHPDMSVPDPHQDAYAMRVLGFWMYLMTDCILFATLFITYAISFRQTFGGATSKDLFDLTTAFLETTVLLLSSVTCGFSVLASIRNEPNKVLFWLFVSFFLGASFIAMEVTEFAGFARAGHDWTKSAFLSSFFTLVGTHGLHVSVGLFWMLIMIFQVGFLGITMMTFRHLVLFSMFWHFLDVVWIFIFTFVYLMGVIL